MTIQTANFVVIRDGENYRCKGEDLKNLVKQSDELILQRGDTVYRLHLALGLGKIESSNQDNTHDYNFGRYLKIINTTTGQVLPASDFCDACYHPSLRDPRRLFDGNDTPEGRLQWATRGNSGIYSTLVIDFPGKIPVYESIEIKAGFSEFSKTGQLLINGEVVRELDAWDRYPESFTAQYTGVIDTFAIRMKNVAPLLDPTYSNNTTGAINYIKIDGRQLTDIQQFTRKVVMEEGTDMSIYKPFMRITDAGGNEGVIGDVDEPNRTLWLFGYVYDQFPSGSEILVDQPGRETYEIPEILNTDIFVCTDTDEVTYKVTGEQFKALFAGEECVPDEQGYQDAFTQIRTEFSRCKLLCESDYCASICKKEYDNSIWWAETHFLCKDPDRDKPNGWKPANPYE